MSKETVLIIEDEKNILELVKYNVEQAGFLVQSASRGDLGFDLARKIKPDLIILDLMLPGMDGIEVCKALRQNEKTTALPIIMLTAKSQEIDRIVGLELGADDYVTKPFSPGELVARIKAVLRRGKEKPTEKIFRVGNLEMDTSRHQVRVQKRETELTSKEYDLLKAFFEAQGRVLSREFLLEKVWGYTEGLNIETRTIDMHIGQLRKKLKNDGDRIVTVKNVGYRFEVE